MLSFCFSTYICLIHCIDQPKTFTLLLKSKILDFKTISHIHVYCIVYVSYRQCPYRIRIDTAADRIVPALEIEGYIINYLLYIHILLFFVVIKKGVNLVDRLCFNELNSRISLRMFVIW